MEANPYAPPQADIVSPSLTSDAEQIRKDHIQTESVVKSLGMLYYLGTLALISIGVTQLLTAEISGKARATDLFQFAGIEFIALGLFCGVMGYSLRHLHRWSRFAAILFAIIGLVRFPLTIGAVINIYVLYHFCGKKATMVFSAPYKAIIAATPQVKNKTSKAAIILLLVIIALIVLLVLSGLFVSPSNH